MRVSRSAACYNSSLKPGTEKSETSDHTHMQMGEGALIMQDLKVWDQMSVHENAVPSRNVASLCCVCMAIWMVTSSKRIGLVLSWFFIEYAAIKDICAYGRFTCILLQLLK